MTRCSTIARPSVVGYRSAGPDARPAFTLVEAILALVILGVMAAIAIPRLANSAVWRVAGEASAQQVVGAMRLARTMSVETAAVEPGGYTVKGGTTAYAIYKTTGMTQVGDTQSLAAGWQFTANFEVRFDSLGAAGGAPIGADAFGLGRSGDQWLISVEPATGCITYRRG